MATDTAAIAAEIANLPDEQLLAMLDPNETYIYEEMASSTVHTLRKDLDDGDAMGREDTEEDIVDSVYGRDPQGAWRTHEAISEYIRRLVAAHVKALYPRAWSLALEPLDPADDDKGD